MEWKESWRIEFAPPKVLRALFGGSVIHCYPIVLYTSYNTEYTLSALPMYLPLTPTASFPSLIYLLSLPSLPPLPYLPSLPHSLFFLPPFCTLYFSPSLEGYFIQCYPIRYILSPQWNHKTTSVLFIIRWIIYSSAFLNSPSFPSGGFIFTGL